MFDVGMEDRFTVLLAAEANLRARREADAELLQVALSWADLHPDPCLPPAADQFEVRRRQLAGLVGVRMGGPGTPLVLACCPAEFGAVLETTATGAKHLIADALDLRDRLPRLRQTVQAGRVAAWKARRVAAATRHLTHEQTANVDAVVHAVIATLGWARFEAILDATIAQADPAAAAAAEVEAASRRFVAVGRTNDHHIRTLIARGTSLDVLSFLAAVHRIGDLLGVEGDPDPVEVRRSKAIGILARPAHALALLARHQNDDASEDPEGDGHLSSPSTSPLLGSGHRCGCGPRLQLQVHLTDAALTGRDPTAVCRIDGIGPVTATTVRDWLGRTDISVTVRPTIVPDPPPADAYEIPQAIRDALAARHPGSVYPWSNAAGPQVDLDHTIPYVSPERGGPPGQTAVDKLGPLTRPEHNTKTFGHLKVRQPAPGVYLWRSRHGWTWLVTNTGTHPLGNNPAAHALWQAAKPPPAPPEPRREAPDPEPATRYRIDFIRPRVPIEIVLVHPAAGP